MATDPIFTARSGRSAKRTSLISVSRPWRTWREAAVYSRNGRKGGKRGQGPSIYSISIGLVLAGFGVDNDDEKLVMVTFYRGALPEGVGWGGSQDSAPLLGRGSVYDDDRPVVEGARARGSTGKGQRRGGALEKGRRSDVAGGEKHEHRVS